MRVICDISLSVSRSFLGRLGRPSMILAASLLFRSGNSGKHCHVSYDSNSHLIHRTQVPSQPSGAGRGSTLSIRPHKPRSRLQAKCLEFCRELVEDNGIETHIVIFAALNVVMRLPDAAEPLVSASDYGSEPGSMRWSGTLGEAEIS
jgi:hypothetical protein